MGTAAPLSSDCCGVQGAFSTLHQASPLGRMPYGNHTGVTWRFVEVKRMKGWEPKPDCLDSSCFAWSKELSNESFVPSMYNRGDGSTYFIAFLWGLNKIICEQGLVHS